MKTLKIFSIVLGAHLLALPLVILQLGRGPGKSSNDTVMETLPDADSIQKVETADSPSAPGQGEPSTQLHIVRQGENPSTIAAEYGMSTSSLMELNGIKDVRSLRVGERLRVLRKDG